MKDAVVPDSNHVDLLRLRLELDRLRVELAERRGREADLDRREARLVTEMASLRDTRLASLNLIEDAVEAGKRMADANDALRAEVRAREQAQAEVLQERDLLRRVLDTLPGIFYLLDAQGHFLRWNLEFERGSGYAPEEIAGMHPLDFFTGDDRALIARRIAEVFSNGHSDAEADFTAKDGSKSPYYFSGRRILIDGEPCLVGMGVDISERLRTEAATRALELQLRESQKMEAVGTLAGGIAHDFNNILAALLGQVSLTRDTLPPDHPARQGLEQIRRSAVRARSLVQQILAFSRRSPPELKAQLLRPLVEEALAMLRATLPALVTLEARLDDPMACARVDATQIEQVLLNLCTNAWHALGSEAGRVVVTLDTLDVAPDSGLARAAKLAPGAYVSLQVRDTGVGMDAATRSRVFEPFFTTKPVGSGTGLGLSVVHGIVAAHGGTITVDSEPGRGSEFRILLPSVPSAEEQQSGFGALGAPDGGRGERVLYVDDDETVGLVVGGLLARAGYRAVSVGDAQSALAALRADPGGFDLVLTDYNMPGMSGLELARAVRALDPELPVIISSGHVDSDLQANATALRVNAVLNKERLVEDMIPLVRSVLCGPVTD